MSLFSSFSDTLKPHYSSIITAVVICILTAVYLLIIMPNNERNVDANNLRVFNGIEEQLKGYIDDKLQGVSPEQIKAIKNKKENRDFFEKHSSCYIYKIEILPLATVNAVSKQLLLKRRIFFKSYIDTTKIDSSDVGVRFDLKEFLKRINASSNFKSFFICPVTTVSDKKDSDEKINFKQNAGSQNNNGSDNQNTSSEKAKKEQNNASKCFVSEALISQNVYLKDEDSLCFNNRNYGPITFKGSNIRYYTNQLRIPDTNFTLFFAAGVNSTNFRSNVHYIKPNHLILGLLLTGILFLSIFLIKPVVMSYKELLSQMDLVRVVFSIGSLIAILVIFGMVSFWKTTVFNRNKSDLKQLVEHIDTSFTNQINIFKDCRKDQIERNKLDTSKFDFKKIDKIVSNQLKFLDVYFWMNKEGLLTASLDRDSISFPRKFNDRDYFKLLQNKEINTVLTGVFSRERDEFQWIYAEKVDATASSEKHAIKGFAFREQFSKEIKLSPDTDYMLVDRAGNVLTQYNNPYNLNKSSSKKLYQNVLLGTNSNLVLESVLAGSGIKDFRMDYQGTSYQVFAKKLSVSTGLPVYILGIRELSYINYLSQFTFINAFLIVLSYCLVLVLLVLVYSSILYRRRFSFFSRVHFYHLFHDYSRKEEYIKLSYINCACLLLVFIVFLFCLPITALYFCLLIGFNITFMNVIILNSRSNLFNCSSNLFKSNRLRFYLLVFSLSFALPLVLFWYDKLYISTIVMITSHIGIILFYIKEYNVGNTEAIPQVKKVQRKAYLKFTTSLMMNHFVMFPFILVCAFYSNEINDYARYYCSPSQPEISKDVSIKTKAYGCDCESGGSMISNDTLQIGSNNEGFIHKLNFGFKEPTAGEIRNYTFKNLYKNLYFKIYVIFFELGFALFYLILGAVLILFLAYSLLNYYSNRFFFFELMQISYFGYYPINKSNLSNEQSFIEEVFDSTKNPKTQSVTFEEEVQKEINTAFGKDDNFEVIPLFRNEFKLNSELKYFDESYSKIWEFISNKESEIKVPDINDESKKTAKHNSQMQNVIFDFSQDSFSNYKNKDIIMELMDLGLINHNEATGRLQIRRESFRRYILLKSRQDNEFAEEFKKDSMNGTFDKFRLPILIIAISLLVLLMYLNKDSYDKVMIFGGSVGSAILLMNKFLEFGKR
nr:hypothetical protein [uncultured Flavobacterium sp.]